ncbi:MAG: transglutaminase-like protein [Rhodobacteraceae bacterium HLUCCO07]|nr:MAG: transglutaminase-like protein [Rhodobacteraceae bacterium HLUCCO07]
MRAEDFRCDLSIRFDPWGFADDPALEVLLPLPCDDGYQRVRDLCAPEGAHIEDMHGHRRLVRLRHGEAVEISARIETRRLRPGDHLDLPPPGPADRSPGPMTAPDAALRALAEDSVSGIEGAQARVAALARAAADALRYRYPKDARGAALSYARGWGDCGEYAFVFVALCHAVGIPARPVFGLITAPWMQTPHAWAEAWDGAGWCPVDPNFVREGAYFGPLLETARGAAAHVGGLDPYRVVISRHTAIPWPSGAVGRPGDVSGLTLTCEGLGAVAIWHETPRWQGAPVVPFLQLPWPAIRRPARATPLRWLRRQRAWRVRVKAPSRRLPRRPLAWADVVALHPIKGATAVLLASGLASGVPVLAPMVEAGVWIWVAAFSVGLLRNMRLMRLRSALWLKTEAALRKRTATALARWNVAEGSG